MLNNSLKKRCRDCGKIKLLDDFVKASNMKDGYLNQCKDCKNKKNKDYLKNNPDKAKVYATRKLINGKKTYWKNPEKYRTAARGYYKKNPRYYINYMNKYNQKLRDKYGRLPKRGQDFKKSEKKPCLICGQILPIHAHHPNYFKPKYVIWLCPLHHKEAHQRIKENDIKRYKTAWVFLIDVLLDDNAINYLIVRVAV